MKIKKFKNESKFKKGKSKKKLIRIFKRRRE